MTINISTTAEGTAPEALTSKPFNTDIAAVREEVRQALLAGANGDYDYSRQRPYSVRLGDGTIIEYK
jgi:hypothetical protein